MFMNYLNRLSILCKRNLLFLNRVRVTLNVSILLLIIELCGDLHMLLTLSHTGFWVFSAQEGPEPHKHVPKEHASSATEHTTSVHASVKKSI